MDSKTFISRLSMESGLSPDKATATLEALTGVITDFCKEMDAIAVPGFGTFQPIKNDEKIIVDDSGKRTLMPPSVSIEFKSSIILRKSLGK
ncbi:MAG: HU family DNA-binding protein [Paramuribaculum sp.]|nr:HU family DNA-binding protein [Paramuribaculum sp.]